MHISWGKDGVAWSWSSGLAAVTWLDWASRVRWHRGVKWITCTQSTVYFNKNMLIWSLSERPYIRLGPKVKTSSVFFVSLCVWGKRLLLLLLANASRLCPIFQFNNTYLVLTSSWFGHHKVNFPLECWLRNLRVKTHRSPSTPSYQSSTHFLSSSFFSCLSSPLFPPPLTFSPSLASPIHISPFTSSRVLSCPFPSVFFFGCCSSECSL